MLVRRRRGWEIPEAEATPEALFLDRRQWLKTVAGGLAATAPLSIALSRPAHAAMGTARYPAARNPRYTLDRPLSAETLVESYNNFYEFSFDKTVAAAAQALKPDPWTVQIDGMVDKPLTLSFDDLMKRVTLEERLYRHRCVETWSMAVPWTGFPLKTIVDLAKPQSGAKYLRFETFTDTSVAPEEGDPLYPWPYVEGLTMAEATNELAFIATGIYGKPLPKQNGAPLRLTVPWKYGFKSIKSIVRFSFVAERPVSFWQSLQSSEYGFWANVNPAVPHPRWSQAEETPLGSLTRRPTLIWNGYGDAVAGLYKGLESERLFA
jgi:sulfoxide reductase catalytic subunit YedY